MADQAVSTAGLNVQVKLTDSPGARVPLKAPPPCLVASAVQVVQPVPVTLTLVSVSVPELASLTTIVTGEPAYTGLAGVWLTVVSVVAGVLHVLMLPWT